jgi:hypothetical protein
MRRIGRNVYAEIYFSRSEYELTSKDVEIELPA